MSMRGGTVYLDSALAPLAAWLGRSDVTDIFINQPGEVWVEAMDGAINRHSAPELTPATLLLLARQIAAQSAQGINREHPLLAASLPTGERVQIVLPPATRGEIAIAIRKQVVSDIALEAYRGAEAAPARPQTAQPQSAAALDPVDLLREAVTARKNILISGGTSSGKTTLLNALVREIALNERLILIEDTAEVVVHHPNSIGLLAARGSLGEADVMPEDLLIAALRMRPDRIILGELRGREAATFLRAVNTGHPGSLTTIHADSPARALDQLALLVMQTGIGLGWDETMRYIERSIDLVVQVGRGSAGRGIVGVLDMNNRHEVTTSGAA